MLYIVALRKGYVFCRYEWLVFISCLISRLSPSQWFGSYEKLPSRDDEEDSDEEDPPISELIYRRSCKDKMKLVFLLSLYFFCMILAAIFAFYSIQGLVFSYQHRVRTVEYVNVDKFHPIGIAVFPEDFAHFNSCEFKYNDDLRPDRGNWTDVLPAGVEQNCTYITITFNSSLVRANRTAMVFRGPTQVKLKQSLALLFTINTTSRAFSGMEYLLIEYWDNLFNLSYKDQQKTLADHEANTTLYNVPAGFRSWVKLFYILKNEIPGQNKSDFFVQTDYSIYNDQRNISDRTTNVIYALFEWKDPFYEYIGTVVSTTIVNTIGAMAGVFLTLQRAANFFWRWVQRIRREREKKLVKLQELQEKQKAVLVEYEKKKEERKFKKQNSVKKLDI